MNFFLVSVFLLTLSLWALPASSAQTCSFTLSASNQSYNVSGGACGQVSVVFANGVSGSGITCNNATIGASSSILAAGNNRGVYLRNCTVDNPKITLGSHSSLYIMGNASPSLSPVFSDNTSNITVMHYLRVNVFEPFGYSTTAFGSRAAGFSYIFPLFNHTLRYNNTELQMSEFFDWRFENGFSSIAERVPMGAYNMSQSDIETNYYTTPYGQIKGWKTFPVSDYTLSKNGRVSYNPYEVDYSFLAYDQLVMYTINITRNVNLTPMYIQPIFPPFNFYMLPDNFSRTVQIRYVVAVPPQDYNWNFTDYLYRYDPSEFTTNPVSGGVGNRSTLYSAFSRPGYAPNMTQNGTAFYFVNYTAQLALGINSSIMTAQGYIPGLGSFVQDSTTPSFSLGLGYCALAENLTVKMNDLTINRSGTYDMVSKLLPLSAPATPQLVNKPCSVGVVITGNDITLNCNGGTINDTSVGIEVNNSRNVNINGCNIEGNGVDIRNSEGVSFSNLTLTSTNASDFGVRISDVQSMNFFNISIGNGYNSSFSVFSSSGTPFSEGVEVYNLSICGQENISAIRQFAFVYSSKNTCASGLSAVSNISINPLYELAALSLGLIAAYAYIFLSRRRNGRRHRHGAARRAGSRK